MIESFLYGTLICGQALYWFLLKYETELREEECWRMLNILTRPASSTDIASPALGAKSRWRCSDNTKIGLQRPRFIHSAWRLFPPISDISSGDH
jgi:hypothetical protein